MSLAKKIAKKFYAEEVKACAGGQRRHEQLLEYIIYGVENTLAEVITFLNQEFSKYENILLQEDARKKCDNKFYKGALEAVEYIIGQMASLQGIKGKKSTVNEENHHEL